MKWQSITTAVMTPSKAWPDFSNYTIRFPITWYLLEWHRVSVSYYVGTDFHQYWLLGYMARFFTSGMAVPCAVVKSGLYFFLFNVICSIQQKFVNWYYISINLYLSWDVWWRINPINWLYMQICNLLLGEKK